LRQRAALAVITACSLLSMHEVAASAAPGVADAQRHVAEVDAAAPPIPGGQAVTAPVRILDTAHRVGLTTAIPAHATVILPMPHSEGSAWMADLRITVVSPRASGHIAVSPLLSLAQALTGVTFVRGHTVANLAVVVVPGDDDDTSLPNTAYLQNVSSKAVDLVVDFMGYTAGGQPPLAGLTELAEPQRLLDTATGLGGRRGAVPARGSVAFLAAGPNLNNVAGGAGTNVAAALLEVTAVSPRAAGAIAAAADQAGRPSTFDVSFARGMSTTNLVEVPVGTDNKIRLYNESAGAVGVTVDLLGFYRRQQGNPSWTGAFHQVTSRRLFDTGSRLRASAIPAHHAEQVRVAGIDGISTTRTAAVLMNLTTVTPAASGSLQAYAGGSHRPIGSSVLINRGTTTSSTAMIPVSSDGTIELYNTSSHPVHVLGDIKGYYLNARPMVANALPNWSTISLPAPAGSVVIYTAASCAAPEFCALLGYRGGTNDYVTTVQGSQVTGLYQLPQIKPDGGNSPGRRTIACTSSSFCITDLSGDGSYQFDGQSWTPVTGPTPTGELACGTPTFCIAQSSGDSDERYDGTQWTPIARPDFPSRPYQQEPTTGLSCSGATFCMAIGAWGDTSIYNGVTWQPPVHAYSTYLASTNSVSCASPTHCVMLDTDGNVTTYTNGRWSTPYSVVFDGGTSIITCPTTTFCAIADGDTAITKTTAGWSTVRSIYDPEHNSINPLSCASPTYCIGTDDTNTAAVSQ
jgi:hypothetical protein